MRRSSERGTSVVEMLVVVAVLGILLITALPQLSVPSQVPVGEAARDVAADLGLARQLAIAGRVNYVLTFTPAAGPFTSYSVAPQGSAPGPDFPKTVPAGVVATGTQQITFAPNGSASPSATLTFTRGTATAQVQVVAATGFVQETGP